jgi:hypothetical protein
MAQWIEADDDSNNSSFINMDHIVKAFCQTIDDVNSLQFVDVAGTTHQSAATFATVADAEAILRALVQGYDIVGTA